MLQINCCEYTGTMERSRPDDDVHMAAPCRGCLKQSISLSGISGYEAPNWLQNSPDVKRRTDAATMKQISERKRKYPNRREKTTSGSGLFRGEKDKAILRSGKRSAPHDVKQRRRKGKGEAKEKNVSETGWKGRRSMRMLPFVY